MICALLAPLALAARAEAPTPAPKAAMVTTRVGVWSRVATLRVRPDKMLEDSRCPMNARCVWAGRATVRITLRDGTRPRQVNVTLGESVPVRGGQLALVSVTPERMAGAQQKKREPYRFAFEFRP